MAVAVLVVVNADVVVAEEPVVVAAVVVTVAAIVVDRGVGVENAGTEECGAEQCEKQGRGVFHGSWTAILYTLFGENRAPAPHEARFSKERNSPLKTRKRSP